MNHRKFLPLAALGALSLCFAATLAADSLRFAGVLGNSGEQGATLVKFGEKTAPGIGVLHDKQGALWDRGGAGVLNRYAPDGRLLATYPIPPDAARTERDKIVAVGDVIFLKLGNKLYSLPANAPAGTPPAVFPLEANRISFNAHDGWVAATLDTAVFLFNAAGEKRAVTTLAGKPDDIDIGPDGGVYVSGAGKVTRVDAGATTAAEKGPWPSIGERLQWLDGHWYGNAWHGTIRRFTPEFTLDPGVVLGGASGSFIGYVEGNTDIENAQGLAHAGGELFAVSGIEGCLHLLSWSEADKRFTILRRIGAIPAAGPLAIDSKGRVWFDGGVWGETDGPDAPRRQCVPPGDDGLAFGASMLPNDVLVAPAYRWGKPTVYAGNFDGPARLFGGVDDLPKTAVTSTIVTVAKRAVLVVLDATGKGKVYNVGTDGRPSGAASDVVLNAKAPLKGVTSLASVAPEKLTAAAGGELVEFSWAGGAWTETARWNRWSDALASQFGARVHVAASAGRLWVSDTERHRVLGFDAATRRLLGVFGTVNAPGSTLETLNAPSTIAANGNRVVVYDSGNQRLVRLDYSAE